MKKRIWQRLLATMISAVAVTIVVTAPAFASEDTSADGYGPFVDMDGSIYEDGAAALWAAGVTSGCDEWRFCPDDPISREQMATFIARALELDETDADSFDDIDESPFRGEIESIAAAGVTKGCGDRLFCPSSDVSRGQMASFLARALDLPPADNDTFTDINGSVYESDIARLSASGVTSGCGEGLYCPDRAVTRAEMATLLTRALDLDVPAELPAIPQDVVSEYENDGSASAWPEGGVEAWRPLVAQYFEAADVDHAMRVLACESNGDPNARNPYSGASGLFQHIPRFWAERSVAAGYGGGSIFDPVTNVAVAAWMIYDYPTGGWQHWVCKG